jgi:hypothetical protein
MSGDSKMVWRWIKEELPKESQYVLVVFDDGSMEVAERIGDAWWAHGMLDFNYGFDVPVAWMPLPEPPVELS